jgi:hypothetical protein
MLDKMKITNLRTKTENFEKNYCDLTFSPKHKWTGGVNAVVMAYTREAVWGYFEGKC